MEFKIKRLNGDYMMSKECKNLFYEIRDYSDDEYTMEEFIEMIKEFVKWNKGNVRVALINLNNYGFPIGEMFVAYDDMGGAMNTTIYTTFEYMDLMIETFDEYNEQEYLEYFWIPRLKELINNIQY